MNLIIHLVEGTIITLDRNVTQEDIDNFYKIIDQKEGGMIQFLTLTGKNYIIPLDKILYFETKQNI